jgi:hypothetical protein
MSQRQKHRLETVNHLSEGFPSMFCALLTGIILPGISVIFSLNAGVPAGFYLNTIEGLFQS